MRILAVDPGGRRFGLALADGASGVSVPLEVQPYHGLVDAARRIAAMVADHRAELVVIGLPTSANGDETAACARSHALARELGTLGIAIVLQAEHLSSHEARQRARSSGRRPDLPVDDLAAQVIAEDYLAGRPARKGEQC
jgi:putative Holliday junction resolvase